MSDQLDVSQYEAFVDGQAYVSISRFTAVEIAGADRLEVLNNLCTADLKLLATDQGSEAFITDVRGRTIGHVYVFNVSDRLILIGLGNQSERLTTHIDRYVIREDVEISEPADTGCAVLVSGRKTPLELPGVAVASSPQLACGKFESDGRMADWFQVPWTSDRDVLLLGDESAAQKLASLEMSRAGGDVFTAARIESGLPEFEVDFNDENLPQEIDRNDRAISFTKGCYLGQETVARLDALGQIQKKLVRLSLSGQTIPPVRTKLLSDGKPAGEVRSACWSPALEKIVALGFVRRKWFEPGSNLEVEATGQTAIVL